MIFLLPNENTFAVFYDEKFLPTPRPEGVVEVEQLPEGDGVLRINDKGELYREISPPQIIPSSPQSADEPDLLVKIYAETQYQTMLLETRALGGM